MAGEIKMKKAGKGGGRYYVMFSCSLCNEKFGSQSAMEKHKPICKRAPETSPDTSLKVIRKRAPGTSRKAIGKAKGAPDTSWIKKEPQKESSTVGAPEKLNRSTEKSTAAMSVGQKQVTSDSPGSASHSGIPCKAKTEPCETPPASKDCSLTDPLCARPSTQTVDVMAGKTENLITQSEVSGQHSVCQPQTPETSSVQAANTSQPSQVPQVRFPVQLTLSPKYHEPTKNLTASQVLLQNRIRRKKTVCTNTVTMRSILPKKNENVKAADDISDASIPKIQTVYYTSKTDDRDLVGEIKIADNALHLPPPTNELVHSKQKHATVHSLLDPAVKSNALFNLTPTVAQSKSEPTVTASVAQSRQTVPQTLQTSQGLQHVPQSVQQISTTLFQAPLGLAQAPQSLLPSTQNLFQSQQGILQNNQNLIQQFVPQNVILFQPSQGSLLQNSVLLKNETGSQFLPLLTPHPISVQPPLGGIHVLPARSSSVHLPASTAVTTVSTAASSRSVCSTTSIVMGDKYVQSSAKGNGSVSSSVTSSVQSVGRKSFVPGSLPVPLPQIGGANLSCSSQQAQTVLPNATRFVWLPGASISPNGCSNLTGFQPPASTSPLLVTGTGLSSTVGGIHTVASVPQKPDQSVTQTGVDIKQAQRNVESSAIQNAGQLQTGAVRKKLAASVPGAMNVSASIVKQSPQSNVVLLPPVISQGYRLNGIRIGRVITSQSSNISNSTDMNRQKHTGPGTVQSETQNKDSSARGSPVLPVFESESHKTCSSSGQKVHTTKYKTLFPKDQTCMPSARIVPAKYKTLVPKMKLEGTEAKEEFDRLQVTGRGKTEEAKSSVFIKVDSSVHHSQDTAAEVEVLSEFKVSHIATMLLAGSIKSKPSPVVLDDGRPFLPITFTGPYVPKGVQAEAAIRPADEDIAKDTVTFPKKKDVVSDMVAKDTVTFPKKKDVVSDMVAKDTVAFLKRKDVVSDMVDRTEETASSSVDGLKENDSTDTIIQSIKVLGKVVWLFLDFDGPKLLWRFGEKDGKVFAVPLDPDLPREVLNEIQEILLKYRLIIPPGINPICAEYTMKTKEVAKISSQPQVLKPCSQKLLSVTLEARGSLQSRPVSHGCEDMKGQLGGKTAKQSHRCVSHLTGGNLKLQQQKRRKQLIVRERADVIQRSLEAIVQLQRIPLTDSLRQQLKTRMETQKDKRRLQPEVCDREAKPVETDHMKTVHITGKKSTQSQGLQESGSPNMRGNLESIVSKEVHEENDQLQNMNTDNMSEKKLNPGQKQQDLKSDTTDKAACESGTTVPESDQDKIDGHSRQSLQEQIDLKRRDRKRGFISDVSVKSPAEGLGAVSNDTGVRKSFRLVCKPKPNYMHLLQERWFEDGEQALSDSEEGQHTPAKVRKRMGWKSVPQPKSTICKNPHLGRGLQGSKKVSGFDIYIDKADSTEKDDETRHSAVGDSSKLYNQDAVNIEMDESIESQTADRLLQTHADDFKEMVVKKACKSKDSESGVIHYVFYVCEICRSFQSRSEDELATHLKEHYNGELTCKICQFHVAFKQELFEHEALEHTGKPLYNCHVCQIPFFNQAVFRNHVKRHESKTCKTCRLNFPSQADLRLHMEKNHRKRIVCQCKLAFESEDKVRSHYKHCFVDGYQCCLCYLKKSTIPDIQSHVKEEHGHQDELHICNFQYCGASFLTPEELGNHTAVHLSSLR